MEKAIGAFSELGWEKVPNWECILVHRTQGLFLSIYVDDIKMAGKKQNMSQPNETIIEQFSMMFESRISAGAAEKLHGWEKTSRKDGRVVI